MAQYSMVLTFSSEDTAERVKRYILKFGNTAARDGVTVSTHGRDTQNVTATA